MATTSNTYTGNGTNKLFSITFPYLETSDINVYLNGTLQTITTQYTFANATTVEFVTAPGNGAVVLLDRSTDDQTLQATFFPGSSIKANDLNFNFDQVLYLSQETANIAANQSTAGLQTQITAANNTSNTALTTANAATVTANSANTTATGIAGTANTALTNANAAVVTANTATSTANAATVTANSALSTVSGLSGVNLNRIINGNFDIAQRGTSFAAIANSDYSLDRWAWGQAGAMVCTVTQSTDVPNNTFQSSYKVDVTTVDSSIAAGDYAFISQKIEGYNVRDLIGTTFAVSFWVKSPKTGVHCVSFSNSGQNRSYIKEYTVAAVNTWEYKTVTVAGGLITAGTWDWTNGEGLEVGFSLATGSTYQTTSDAWQTGDFLGTANQVNVIDNTANDFFLAGVQLEPGAVATPFERRPIGTELALCQRYYEVGTSSWIGYATAGTGVGSHVSYAATKRAVPTLTTTPFNYTNASGSSVANNTIYGFMPFGTTTATGGVIVYNNFTASAEL